MLNNVPILLIIFNRPDKVKLLVQALEKVRPNKIYIAADGPRFNHPTDQDECAAARAAAMEIPWPCTIKTKFADANRGARFGVTDAIDWFFEQVDEGIILEDDCIPHPSFFSFCSALLNHYRHDEKVMHISGNNFQNGIKRGEGSYYFSLYTHSWGWATWRKAWKQYHLALEQFEEFDKNNDIDSLPLSKSAKKFWLKNFRQTIRGNDSWDSLWMYTVWQKRGLAILPNHNLVSNIGFDQGATHTKQANSLANLRTEELSEIVHPSDRSPNQDADEQAFRNMFHKPLYAKILSKLGAMGT